jgi:PAS domain-containing protein
VYDTTHRKKAEEALHKSQEEYLSLVQSIHEGIVVHASGLDKHTGVSEIIGDSGSKPKSSKASGVVLL